MSITEVLDLLVCPHCAAELGSDDPVAPRTISCPNRHSFDLARQGYLNLGRGSGAKHSGDTAAMISARERFLGAGHYAGLAELIAELVADHCPDAKTVMESGAGTGYYLAEVLGRMPAARGLALDASVPAARRAATLGERVGSVVTDVWSTMPIRPSSIDVIMAVFAPRHPAEFARLIRKKGILLVAAPGDRHLIEIRDSLGLLGVHPDKQASLTASLATGFVPEHTRSYAEQLELSADAVFDLVAMGPNAFHQQDPADLRDRIGNDPTAVTIDVTVSVFAPAG